MKKASCLLLIVLLCMPVYALASDLEITQEAFYVTPYSDYYAGELFCEVTNTTERTIKITDGVYEFYDADGVSVASGSIYSFYPQVLGPGEKGWFSVSSGVKEAETADYIQSYSVSVVGKSANEEQFKYELSDVRFELVSGYRDRIYMYATLTNNNDEPEDGFYVIFALYDADGNLIYCDGAASSGIALHPGSVGDMSTSMDNDIFAALKERGVEPAAIEAVAVSW